MVFFVLYLGIAFIVRWWCLGSSIVLIVMTVWMLDILCIGIVFEFRDDFIILESGSYKVSIFVGV